MTEPTPGPDPEPDGQPPTQRPVREVSIGALIGGFFLIVPLSHVGEERDEDSVHPDKVVDQPLHRPFRARRRRQPLFGSDVGDELTNHGEDTAELLNHGYAVNLTAPHGAAIGRCRIQEAGRCWTTGLFNHGMNTSHRGARRFCIYCRTDDPRAGSLLRAVNLAQRDATLKFDSGI
jgi:hypothetical protein